MKALYLILLVIAAVCFALAAFELGRNRDSRVNASALLAAGLLAWVLVPLIELART